MSVLFILVFLRILGTAHAPKRSRGNFAVALTGTYLVTSTYRMVQSLILAYTISFEVWKHISRVIPRLNHRSFYEVLFIVSMGALVPAVSCRRLNRGRWSSWPCPQPWHRDLSLTRPGRLSAQKRCRVQLGGCMIQWLPRWGSHEGTNPLLLGDDHSN